MISCIAWLCGIGMTQAQVTPLPVQITNKYQADLAPGSTREWISFRRDVTFDAQQIFTQAPDLLGLSERDEMRKFSERTDAAGNKHYKFAQYVNGVRVEGIEYYTHERNGRFHLMNGDVVVGIVDAGAPAISKEQAIATALAQFPAEKYMWEDVRAEKAFKEKRKDPLATLYPTPELLYVKIDPKGDMVAENYVLAYRMYVFADKPQIAEYVYINAHTGAFLRSRSLEISCNPTSMATTFNGMQTVNTDYRFEECGSSYTEETSYYSIDDCTLDSEIRSYYSASYGDYNYGDDWLKCDGDNTWVNTGQQLMVMTTLWSTRKSMNYYINVHGHESFDGTSGLIDLFSNRTYFDDFGDPHCSNANYTNIIDNLNFGSGDDCMPGTTDDYNTLDIVGHEFTHGVIEYAHFDALDYSDESGALNESFADIFGEMVEYYTEGDSISWLMAEDRGAIRSYSNPNAYGDPDTYFGTNWATLGGDDNGGVHTNSSVQNFMFYLLSEGGSGTNDHGTPYAVDGIGYDHARDIAWVAMMDYLDGSDGYVIARNAWIQAATDLFGSCSQEVISVGQAFQAVGVTEYTAFDLASFCGTYVFSGYADATYGVENATIVLGDFLVDCATTVNATAVVTLKSGNYIQLNPGFNALSGCNLTAWIDPCEISEYDPDNVRVGQQADAPLSTPEVSDKLTIFPNPATNTATIKWELSSPMKTMHVVNIAGQEVSALIPVQEVMDAQLELDVHAIPPGMYMLIIETDAGIFTGTLVKQ